MRSAEAIRKFLEKDDLKYQVEKENEDVVIFRMGICIDENLASARGDIRIICEKDRVTSLANIGVVADEKRYAEAAEFITRVNYELANMSKFKMNFIDSEIRVWYEMDCNWEIKLTEDGIRACYEVDYSGVIRFIEDMVRRIVYPSANIALLDVLFGYATPEEAVETVKRSIEQQPEYHHRTDTWRHQRKPWKR